MNDLKEEEEAQFFKQESDDLRKNYSKAIRGEESQQNSEAARAQYIIYSFLIIYSIILIVFVTLLYQFASLRFYFFDLMQEISENGSIQGALMICITGFILVLTGFNVVLYDVIAGFLLKPFWFGLLIVSLAKVLGKYNLLHKKRYVGFCLGRYSLRSFIYKAMDQNIYFITCYLAAEQKPVKLMFSVQFMAIPTLFKTYACGLFRITHWQYLYPTIFGTVIWAAFWVYIGNQLDSLIELLQSGDTSSFVPMWVQGILIIVLIVIIIYFFIFTKDIYNDIKADANLDRLSEHIQREESFQQRESQTKQSLDQQNSVN